MFRIAIRGADEFVVRAIQAEWEALGGAEVGVALFGEALVAVAFVGLAFVETGVVGGEVVGDSVIGDSSWVELDSKETVVGATVVDFDWVDSCTVVPMLTIWKNKCIND